jgi:hypothetical protein
MAMTLPASSPAPANPASLDHILLVIVALVGAIQGLEGLSGLSTPSDDIAKIPGYSLGGLTNLASTVLHPILSFAAVAFALMRRLRWGIAALALLALGAWAVGELPSVIKHGFVLGGDAFVGAQDIYRGIVSPALALLAVAAAWFDRHLAAATIAVMLPPIVAAAGVVAFAISVIMYGF